LYCPSNTLLLYPTNSTLTTFLPFPTPFPYTSLFRSNSVCEIFPFQNASNARFHSRFSPIRGYPKFELLIFAIPYFLHFLTYFMKDRKSTRLNSSHVSNSYAVFFFKKKIIK